MKIKRNFFVGASAARHWGAACACGAALLVSGCDSDAGGASTTTESDTATSDSGSSDTSGGDTSGGDTSSGDTMAAVFELIGTWATPYGTDDVITQTTWNKAKIVEFDNAANLGFTQEPADDPYNPNKFNKVVWTEPKNNTFYYCMVDYGKDSLALAKASTLTADASDPDTKGCGGKFPWTKATKK
ncbi:MAG: hypothetical protein HY902_01725 [Deltaproteobacteria bacterium]|nr:hypothetical protein [Deltaproteobacteria bacterium]